MDTMGIHRRKCRPVESVQSLHWLLAHVAFMCPRVRFFVFALTRWVPDVEDTIHDGIRSASGEEPHLFYGGGHGGGGSREHDGGSVGGHGGGGPAHDPPLRSGGGSATGGLKPLCKVMQCVNKY